MGWCDYIGMANYRPPYPIVRPTDMSPREQIRLVPGEELDPLTRAELDNLRAGIVYQFTIADTPANRESFNFKALYFQLVAYKEGWEFKPENLQVVYLPPDDPVFGSGEYQSRVFQLQRRAEPASPTDTPTPLLFPTDRGRLGFRSTSSAASSWRVMGPDEADELADKVEELFH